MKKVTAKNDRIQRLAKQLEDKCMQSLIHETQAITTKFDTPFVCMIDSIAETFGETRTALLQTIIEEGITQLFDSIDSSYHDELAAKADEKTTQYMLSKGHSIKSTNSAGSFENEWSYWRERVALPARLAQMSEANSGDVE